MKKRVIALGMAFFVSACTGLEPTGKALSPAPSVKPETTTHRKPATPKKSSLPEAVESTMKHDPSLTPDKEIRPTPYAAPPRKVPVYPMNTDSIRSKSEVYRDLNTGRSKSDYLQTWPRERDPFFDTVNRTGSNPMNTQDRTTNRPANR